MCNKFVFLLILIFGLVCVGGVSANDQLSLNTTDAVTDSGLNTEVMILYIMIVSLIVMLLLKIVNQNHLMI